MRHENERNPLTEQWLPPAARTANRSWIEIVAAETGKPHAEGGATHIEKGLSSLPRFGRIAEAARLHTP
jgi:hypothetical protein